MPGTAHPGAIRANDQPDGCFLGVAGGVAAGWCGSFHQAATAMRAALGIGFNRLTAEWAGFIGHSSGLKCAEYFPCLPGKTCLDIAAALDA